MGNRVSKAVEKPLSGLAYLPNDPGTPDIMEEIKVPSLPTGSPEITVVGMRPGMPVGRGSAEEQAAQVYSAMVFAISTAQSALPVPFKTWAVVGNLVAIPRAGQQLNALYDRSSLRFFHWVNRVANKVAYTCDSADVVSHEIGHAILDALRPELWNMQSLEVSAFHEAFGDCLAVLSSLQHRSVIERVIQQTGGDLKQSNAASRVAESLGAAIMAAGGVASSLALRDAVNSFTYVKPEDLPERAPVDKLSRDPHRFGLVFLGAFWDVIAALCRHAVESGTDRADAIIHARERAAKLLFTAVCKAKARPKFLASVARAMVAAEEETFDGEHSATLRRLFNARGLICDVPFAAQFGGDGLEPVMPVEDSETIKVSVASFNQAQAYMAAAAGCHHEEAVIDCNLAVQSAIARGLVGGYDAMFMVDGGHLVRNYICQREVWDPNAS